jgi:hypothetical protein
MNEVGASNEEATAVFNISSSGLVGKWKQLAEIRGNDALKPSIQERPSMKKLPKKAQLVVGSEKALRAEIEYPTYGECVFKKVEGLNSREGKITEQDKANVIFVLRLEFKVIDLVKVAGIPRSTYYYWVKQMDWPDKHKEVIQ